MYALQLLLTQMQSSFVQMLPGLPFSVLYPHDFQRSRVHALLACCFVRAFSILTDDRSLRKICKFIVVFAVVELNPEMREWNIQIIKAIAIKRTYSCGS
jgi:hypothetical protein